MAVNLTTVDAAIESIQSNGQSVTVDGQTYTQATISSLISLRRQLQREALRSGGSRPLMRAVNLSGMGYD